MSDHDEQIRERVRAWMAERHPGRGGLARAAEAMGITRVMLGEYLKGHRGAGGEKTARGIAKVLGITTDEVFGLPKRRVLHATEDPDVVHPVLGSRPGAHEALARAKRQEPWFPAFAWEDAMATATLIAPAVVTPAMLVAAARLSMSVRSGEQLDEATMAQAEAEEADREARQIEAQRLVREAEARGEKLDPIKVMNDLRLRNQRAELDAAKARDAAHGTANDAPPAPANDGTKKRGGRKG